MKALIIVQNFLSKPINLMVVWFHNMIKEVCFFMIKAVFFDMDDTLLWDEKSVHEAFEATCKIAKEKYHVDAKELEEAVRHEAKNLYSLYETYSYVSQIGINPFEALWSDFSEPINNNLKKLSELAPQYRKEAWNRGLKKVGIDDFDLAVELSEQFPKERRKRPIVYEETFEVLNQLKEKYELLLLTNGDPSLQKEKIASVPQFSSYFKHIVISGEFGKGKPDPSLFQHALSLMNVNENEVVMVGDKLSTDILGACQSNIPSVWLNRKKLDRYMDVEPDYEIHHLQELVDLLQKAPVNR